MKKILLSFGSIVFASALLAGTTGAWFNQNPNTSTGNTFANGIIELKIDNESYVTSTTTGSLIFSTTTSWGLDKLAGHLFFNFDDLKPSDIGEDTISLHVKENNAWACMNIKLTDTPENGQPEPEALVDATVGANQGELQEVLQFTFWADDGDNVLEQNEVAKIFKQGLVKDIFNGANWTLADSQTNIWGGSGPLEANKVKYIGKAWCFGTLAQTPLTQDTLGKTTNGPGGKPTNGPLQRGTGFNCDGSGLGNEYQSDGIKLNVSFSVAQSRGNGGYKCGGGNNDPKGSISGMKFKDANKSYSKDGGDTALSGWTIGISSGGATTTTTTSGSGGYSFNNLVAGNYLVCEVQQAGWTQSYPASICYKVTLSAGQHVTGKDFGNFKKKEEKPQYCSHGYWKQSQHFDSWAGYSPNQQFSSVFDNAFPGKTLLQVLQLGGGSLNELGRETVGALLNAGSVTFPYTEAQVISMFNATYPGSSGAYNTLTDKFELDENCPLN